MITDLPKVFQIPKIPDDRGNLSFIESDVHVPFPISRVYWIYDVPGGEIRGGHAYRQIDEFIIAISGSFDVVLHDGINEFQFSLNRSYYGLYIPKMYWRKIMNFSTNSVAAVLTNYRYDENEYIRSFQEFLDLKGL
jgi:hypothetical protein